jgi:hypothetical protein
LNVTDLKGDKKFYLGANDKEDGKIPICGRPSREEGWLLFKKGKINKKPCEKCAKGLGVFPECVSLGGMYGGACANCV